MRDHLTFDELMAGLPHIASSPTHDGMLKAIVIRPRKGERQSLAQCELSPEGGVHGDNWVNECWLTLPDGASHPDVQVSLINARAIQLLAGEEDRWSLAGDNLIVDFNLHVDNVPPGQRLQIGSVVLEMSAQPHKGCKKITQLFGDGAFPFLNSKEGKDLQLRGIYAKVIEGGTVQVDDIITKI
jgi:MOSC domain-containing protein YiiM